MVTLKGSEALTNSDAEIEIVGTDIPNPVGGIFCTIQMRIVGGSFRNTRENLKLDKKSAMKLQEALVQPGVEFGYRGLTLKRKGGMVEANGEIYVAMARRHVKVSGEREVREFGKLVEHLPGGLTLKSEGDAEELLNIGIETVLLDVSESGLDEGD